MARILIIEDSPVAAELESRHLAAAGHTCTIANSGRDAETILKKNSFDLILLDYILPDLNGVDVLKFILNRDPGALVIMVTGQGYEELAAEVIKAGARDYVVKSH